MPENTYISFLQKNTCELSQQCDRVLLSRRLYYYHLPGWIFVQTTLLLSPTRLFDPLSTLTVDIKSIGPKTPKRRSRHYPPHVGSWVETLGSKDRQMGQSRHKRKWLRVLGQVGPKDGLDTTLRTLAVGSKSIGLKRPKKRSGHYPPHVGSWVEKHWAQKTDRWDSPDIDVDNRTQWHIGFI